MENVPRTGILVRRILDLATRALRPPVDRLQIDVHADLAQFLRRHDGLRVGEMRFDRIEDHDFLAFIVRFFEKLLGLFDIGLLVALRPSADAGLGFERRAAHEHRPAGPLVVSKADHRCQVILLIAGRIQQRLACLGIVEGRDQVIHPVDRLRANAVDHFHGDVGVLANQRQKIGLRNLDDVDFAFDERLHRGVGIRNHQPLDAIDLGKLGAGKAVRRIGPWLVVGIFLIDDLAARNPFLANEDERAGADRRRHRGVRIELRIDFARDEQRIFRTRERLEDQSKRLVQTNLESVGAGCHDLFRELHHRHAGRDALRKTQNRRHHVLRRHRLAIVKLESRAQLERPVEAVGALRIALDHLRLRHELAVQREQRVVNHVAVIAGDVVRGLNGVQDLEVGLRHDAQHRLCVRARTGQDQRKRARRGHFPEAASMGIHDSALLLHCRRHSGYGKNLCAIGSTRYGRPQAQLSRTGRRECGT